METLIRSDLDERSCSPFAPEVGALSHGQEEPCGCSARLPGTCQAMQESPRLCRSSAASVRGGARDSKGVLQDYETSECARFKPPQSAPGGRVGEAELLNQISRGVHRCRGIPDDYQVQGFGQWEVAVQSEDFRGEYEPSGSGRNSTDAWGNSGMATPESVPVESCLSIGLERRHGRRSARGCQAVSPNQTGASGGIGQLHPPSAPHAARPDHAEILRPSSE